MKPIDILRNEILTMQQEYGIQKSYLAKRMGLNSQQALNIRLKSNKSTTLGEIKKELINLIKEIYGEDIFEIMENEKDINKIFKK